MISIPHGTYGDALLIGAKWLRLKFFRFCSHSTNARFFRQVSPQCESHLTSVSMLGLTDHHNVFWATAARDRTRPHHVAQAHSMRVEAIGISRHIGARPASDCCRAG